MSTAEALPRRVFVRTSEIPALISGVWRADRAALRRVLGARRTGRVGVALGLGGLALAAPWPEAGAVALLQLALGLDRRPSRDPGLGWLQYQRLSLWLAGTALAAASPLRLLLPDPPGSALGPALVLLGAHGRLRLALRRGLG